MRIGPKLLFVVMGLCFVACGDEDIRIDEDFDNAPNGCIGEECNESDSDDDSATDAIGDDFPRVYPQSEQPDGEESTDDGSELENPDLSCADDDSICRFCGPAVGVVTDCPEGDERMECQVFELVNEVRVDHGLDELDYNGNLAESGMIHAMDLNYCDYFAHDSLDGTTFFDRCADSNYSGTCTGENIGGGQSTPEDVLEAWMDSPGHRANILYEHHNEVGIAYYDEGSGTYGRYWLKHFGRR